MSSQRTAADDVTETDGFYETEDSVAESSELPKENKNALRSTPSPAPMYANVGGTPPPANIAEDQAPAISTDVIEMEDLDDDDVELYVNSPKSVKTVQVESVSWLKC